MAHSSVNTKPGRINDFLHPDTPRPQQHEARDKVFHSIWNLSFIPHNFKERFIKFLKNQLPFNDQLTKANPSLINRKEINKIKLLVAREIIILIRDRISDHLYVQTSYSCLGLIIYFIGMLNLTKKRKYQTSYRNSLFSCYYKSE